MCLSFRASSPVKAASNSDARGQEEQRRGSSAIGPIGIARKEKRGQRGAFRPVHSQERLTLTLADKVYSQLKTEIATTVLEPGTPLREEEIARRFQTSRTPVRQALHALEVEGLVAVEPRRGARVSEVSLREALEVYEIRELLEPYASYRAAIRRTKDEIEQLKEIRARFEEQHVSDDLHVRMQLDFDLHSLINEIGGNQILAEVIQDLRLRSERAFARFSRSFYPRSRREHLELIDAIIRGDGDGARDLALKHLHSAKNELMFGPTE